MSNTKWVIDPAHTEVEFKVRHMMIANVKGNFRGVEGHIEADPQNLNDLKVDVKIDAASVDTGVADRDQHLRSADFFDVENHPHITFKSKKVEPRGGNEYTLTGDLTIRGVTKEVDLDMTFEGQAKDPWGNQRIGVSAETKVNRKDFQLNWNTVLETGGVLVSDDVKISIQAEAVQQAE